MSEKRIIKLKQSLTGFSGITHGLDGSMLELTQACHSAYEDEALGLTIGVFDSANFDSTNIAAAVSTYASDEFMIIIEGEMEIKNNKTGKTETIMAGKSCVIPQGFDCQRYHQEYLRKLYVIYKPQDTQENPVTENIIYIDENSDIPWKETSDGHRKKILYQNNNQRFTAGVWQSKALVTGLINFPYHEFIFIDKGSLICTDEMGVAHNFTKGDALFIPQGTQCSWQVKDKVSIHFAQLK